MKRESNEYSRRRFISTFFRTGSFFLGGAIILSSCDSKKEGGEAGSTTTTKNDCNDLSDVSKSELEKRQKFGYADNSPVKGSNCGNCSLFVPKQGKDCGGCMLFQGPVYTSGYCIQHAPKL